VSELPNITQFQSPAQAFSPAKLIYFAVDFADWGTQEKKPLIPESWPTDKESIKRPTIAESVTAQQKKVGGEVSQGASAATKVGRRGRNCKLKKGQVGPENTSSTLEKAH